jgi:hypothetical protein
VAMAGKASTWKAAGRYYYQSTGLEALYTHHDHDPYQYCDIAYHVDFAKIKCIGSGFISRFYLLKEKYGRRQLTKEFSKG